MRISDWSSDVCSSDLQPDRQAQPQPPAWVAAVGQLQQQPRRQHPPQVVGAGVLQHRTGQHRERHAAHRDRGGDLGEARSEEHTSELQSLMRISYAVFCLKKKTNKQQQKQAYIKTTNK